MRNLIRAALNSIFSIFAKRLDQPVYQPTTYSVFCGTGRVLRCESAELEGNTYIHIAVEFEDGKVICFRDRARFWALPLVRVGDIVSVEYTEFGDDCHILRNFMIHFDCK